MAAEPVPFHELNQITGQQATPEVEQDAEQTADKPPEYEEASRRPPPYSSASPPKIKAPLSPEQLKRRRLALWISTLLLLIVSAVVIVVAVIEAGKSRNSEASWDGPDSGSSGSFGGSGYSEPQPTIGSNRVTSNGSLATAELRGLDWQGILLYQLDDKSIQYQFYRPENSTNSAVNISARRNSSSTPIQAVNLTGIACRTYGSSITSTIHIVIIADNLTMVDWLLDNPGSNDIWRPGQLSTHRFQVLEGTTCSTSQGAGANTRYTCAASPILTFEPGRSWKGLSNGTSLDDASGADDMVRLWGPGAEGLALREYYYQPTQQSWLPNTNTLPSSYILGGLAVQVNVSPAGDMINTTMFHTNSSGLARYDRSDTIINGTVQFESKYWGSPRNTSLWSGSSAPLAIVPVSNSSDAWLYSRASDKDGTLLVARANSTNEHVVANLTTLQTSGPVVYQHSDLVFGVVGI